LVIFLVKNKFNILILIATDVIGGPGKGVIQFMTTANQYIQDLSYELCDFSVKGTPLDEYEFSRTAMAQGIKIRKIDQSCLLDVTMPFQICRHLREGSFSILQTHGYKANVLGMAVHKMTGIPWVAFAHGQTTENRKTRLYSWLDTVAMKYADRVVAVSNGLYEHQLKPAGIPQSKVRVVHNAIDSDSIKPTVNRDQMRKDLALSANNFVIGVIGRFSPEKGQDIFLRAIALAPELGTNFRVLFVGDGPELDRAKSLAADLGVMDKLIFLGYRDDIPNLYQAIDLVVIPSRSEGLPNVLLEALAVGKAVIATDVGGIGEVLENRVNGLLVPFNDVKSLACAMEEIYYNKDLYNQVSGNALQSVKIKFSTEARAKNIFAVYQELLSEK